ncbi:AAA family ATPase [Saccharibacillus kuerlensis]|uniref:Tunicamycin resistance protein n=1 Tax=Saccharibacillus kuerlensis TaxID=459527 RepID=A0ABQ2L3H7_9BACL|nr:AAA family ATPase [Saccharibacillus kuerlensis]GGO01175.1 tunicamycin resistance protein [Saccharibacillus kuerlensis]
MIIWINGAFGSGKTTTAEKLHQRIPGSFFYDPEQAGYFIRDNIPASLHKSDFQDHALWRKINLSMLSTFAREYKGTIIVPMTLVSPQYFDELIGGLRAQGIEVRHFALLARKETLLQRLLGRGEDPDAWCIAQIDRCLSALSQEEFSIPIFTDELTPGEVANTIAAACGIELTEVG